MNNILITLAAVLFAATGFAQDPGVTVVEGDLPTNAPSWYPDEIGNPTINYIYDSGLHDVICEGCNPSTVMENENDEEEFFVVVWNDPTEEITCYITGVKIWGGACKYIEWTEGPWDFEDCVTRIGCSFGVSVFAVASDEAFPSIDFGISEWKRRHDSANPPLFQNTGSVSGTAGPYVDDASGQHNQATEVTISKKIDCGTGPVDLAWSFGFSQNWDGDLSNFDGMTIIEFPGVSCSRCAVEQ